MLESLLRNISDIISPAVHVLKNHHLLEKLRKSEPSLATVGKLKILVFENFFAHAIHPIVNSLHRCNIYRPQRSCEGYVFTRVCHSVHGGGLPQCMLGYPPPRSRAPPGADPPGADPPGAEPPGSKHPPWSRHPQPPQGADPPETATVADGTHPTGMHSCW